MRVREIGLKQGAGSETDNRYYRWRMRGKPSEPAYERQHGDLPGEI